MRTAEACGYRRLDTFTLPVDAWWTDYYTPIEARLRELRVRHAGDPEAERVLDDEQREITMYRTFHDFYGCVFYVLQRSD